MKLLTKILSLTLLPLALFAALPPGAEDLREMREIVDSPVLNQILYPDEGVFFIGKDQGEEGERSVYILESTSHSIAVVVSHEQPTAKPRMLGPIPIQLQFYAIPNEEPMRGSTFKDTFSSTEPVVAEEGESPSLDPDIVKIREILNAPDLYSELAGGRVEFIFRNPVFNVEEVRKDIANEQGDDAKTAAIKDALEHASLEKSEVYFIGVSHPNTETFSQIFAFVLYPENGDATTPTVLFFSPPNNEAGD